MTLTTRSTKGRCAAKTRLCIRWQTASSALAAKDKLLVAGVAEAEAVIQQLAKQTAVEHDEVRFLAEQSIAPFVAGYADGLQRLVKLEP